MTSARKKASRRLSVLREKHSQDLLDMGMMLADVHPRLLRHRTALFDYLVAFDASPKGIHVQIIVKWFFAGAIRLEDGRRIRDLLERFESSKHRLPVDRRDANAFDAPGDIEAMFDGLDGKGDAEKHKIPSWVLEQAPLVGEGDDWAVFRLDTAEASAFWANSTSWCTRHASTFASYSARSPLYVIRLRGERFQMSRSSSQLMDRYDRSVTPDTVQSWPTDLVSCLLDAAGYEEALQPDGQGSRVVRMEDRLLAILLGFQSGAGWAKFVDGDMAWRLIKNKGWLAAVPDPKTGGMKNSEASRDHISEVLDHELCKVRDLPREAIVVADEVEGSLVRIDHNVQRLQRAFLDWNGPCWFVALPDGGEFFVGMSLDVPRIRILSTSELKRDLCPSGAIVAEDGRVVASLDRDRRRVFDLVASHHEWSVFYRAAFGRFLGPMSEKDTDDLKRNLEDCLDGMTSWSRDEALSILAPDETSAIALLSSPFGLSLPKHGKAFDLLTSRCSPPVISLLAGVSTDGSYLQRVEQPIPPTEDDLRAVAHLGGIGHLIVALPVSNRSEALFDHMIAMGRGGVIAGLPAELATSHRVAAAIKVGDFPDRIFDRDSISVTLLRQVRAAEKGMPSLVGAAAFSSMFALIEEKSAMEDLGPDACLRYAYAASSGLDPEALEQHLRHMLSNDTALFRILCREIEEIGIENCDFAFVLALSAVSDVHAEEALRQLKHGSLSRKDYTKLFQMEMLIEACPRLLALDQTELPRFAETTKSRIVAKEPRALAFFSPSDMTPELLEHVARRWQDDLDGGTLGGFVEERFSMAAIGNRSSRPWHDGVYHALRIWQVEDRPAPSAAVVALIPPPQAAHEDYLWDWAKGIETPSFSKTSWWRSFLTWGKRRK